MLVSDIFAVVIITIYILHIPGNKTNKKIL